MGKLAKLEAIRGFTALYVLIHHSLYPGLLVIRGFDLSSLFTFGQEGVMIFFLLSGFVIQYSYEKAQDKSFKLYFAKRFLRIYIPLISVFILNMLIAAYQQDLANFSFTELVGNLLMLQDSEILKPNIICKTFMGNLPLWSLSYEWWFYMIFFLVMKYFKDNSSTIIYILGTISTISYLFYPFFVNSVLMYMLIWWIGVELARLYSSKGIIKIKDLLLPLGIFIFNTLLLRLGLTLNNKDITHILYYTYVEYPNFSSTLFIIAFALIWYKLKFVFFDFTLGLFKPLASISFGLYITHWFLIHTAQYLNFIASPLLRLCLYFIVCVVFSYLIERVIYVKLNKLIMNKFFYNKDIKYNLPS